MPECFKKFVDAMCESVAESLSDTDVEIVYWNMFNKFLHIVTSYPADGMLELLRNWPESDSVATTPRITLASI